MKSTILCEAGEDLEKRDGIMEEVVQSHMFSKVVRCREKRAEGRKPRSGRFYGLVRIGDLDWAIVKWNKDQAPSLQVSDQIRIEVQRWEDPPIVIPENTDRFASVDVDLTMGDVQEEFVPGVPCESA